MAKLKLYNSIEDKESKTVLEGWFGIESTCYEDIKGFIEQIPEDDDVIDIYLHCPGGNCIEGWAMYDALRTSGKKITTVVDGLCASMGTVIMMAAPKERRLAQKNATILIHNPYCTDYFQYEETAHADELDAMANKVRIQAEEMRAEQDKILNLYVERTGTDKETLQALMNEDRCIGTDKALELGLIGDVLEPNTDKLNTIKNKMEKGEVSVKASVLDRMLAKLGIKSVDEVAVNQVITDVTGAEITIDSDSDPVVGDTASPDGEFTMEDGSTLTIADGVITAINKKTEEELEEEEEEEEEEDEPDKEKDDKIAKLESEILDLKGANEALTTERDNLLAEKNELTKSIETLTSEKDALASENETIKAGVKSEDEIAVLDKVNALGGMEWLEMAEKVGSSSVLPNKGFHEGKKEENDEHESIGAGFLAAKRAMRHRI